MFSTETSLQRRSHLPWRGGAAVHGNWFEEDDLSRKALSLYSEARKDKGLAPRGSQLVLRSRMFGAFAVA